MADYVSTVKAFVIQPPEVDQISSTATDWYAAKINDYIESLDSTNEIVYTISTTRMNGGAILVTIFHKATA